MGRTFGSSGLFLGPVQKQAELAILLLIVVGVVCPCFLFMVLFLCFCVYTGCFATLGRYVDTGANLGKQGVGDEILVSRLRFARLGYFSAYSVVHLS